MPRSTTDPAVVAVPAALALAETDVGSGADRVEARARVLVQRAQAGDVAAWSRLYQERFDGLFRHVCFLTGDAATAEDLVQESFARAFVAIGRYDGRSTFDAWVRGIALNVVRMHWRRAQTTHRVHENFARMREVAAVSEGDPDRAHQQDVRMKVLYEVLATLPEHLRETFVLRDIQGLSTQQVADELGISANNVAVRATRARAKIKEELTLLGWLGTEDA